MYRLTPNQLKIITEHLLDLYMKDYSSDDKILSHYDHIDADGDRFKIGFVPSDDGALTMMNIRIVYKGKA